MTGNGQPAGKLPLGQRVDPARVRALEQQAGMYSQLVVQRALSDVSNFINALHVLTEQANAGQPQARQLLLLLGKNLTQASLAAAGVVTPGTP